MTDIDPLEEMADTLYDALYAITPYAEPHFADERQGLRNAVQAVLRQHTQSSNRNPDDRLAAIRSRAQAATPGPWQPYHPDYGPTFYANTTGEHLRGVGDFDFGTGDEAEADQAFVRHARQDVDFLLDRVAELEQAMTQIRHLHKDSPMGPCPVCVDGDAMERGEDPTVPYPCPTGRLAGAQDCNPPSVRQPANG